MHLSLVGAVPAIMTLTASPSYLSSVLHVCELHKYLHILSSDLSSCDLSPSYITYLSSWPQNVVLMPYLFSRALLHTKLRSVHLSDDVL